MRGGSASADAEAAYIQPLLPEEVHLYVTIPDSLLTPAMRASCLKVSRPVFRLRRPLYGWSRSGDIWEKHLSETLQALDKNYEIYKANKLAGDIEKNTSTGWTPVENWPQTFWKRNKGGHINTLTVYVDDFVMAGKDHRNSGRLHRNILLFQSLVLLDVFWVFILILRMGLNPILCPTGFRYVS